MKFSIEKTDLSSAIQTVRPAIGSNNPHPILDGMYLEISSENMLRVMASNSTLQIEFTVAAECMHPGAIVLPGALFSSIVSKLPDETVDIETLEGGQGVRLLCGSFQMNLQGQDADEYPMMPTVSDGHSIQLSQATLKDMINKTLESVATDQARPILTGLLFEVTEGKLNVVGLSSNRMAVRREKLDSFENFQAVISAKPTMKDIAGMLSDDNDLLVSILFGQGSALFDMGSTRVHTAYLAGEYLPYRNIIPQQFQTTASIPRRAFHEAIGRAALLSSHDKKYIRMSIDSDKITLNANSELGFMREELAINATGPSLEIAFNAGYLIDAIGRLSDEYVRMRFQSPEVAGIIEPEQGDGYLYLIAPIQI